MKVDPRLRTAVDSSLGWYVDLFAAHSIRSVIEGGLFRALDSPPPLHSAALTLEPGLTLTHTGFGGLADNFADQELGEVGMSVLFEATWIHRAPSASSVSPLPPGWSRVTTDGLAEWNSTSDTTGVVVPSLLADPRLAVLERRDGGVFTTGCIASLGTGAIYLSNVHSAADAVTDWQQVVDAVWANYPDRPLVGYERGVDLTLARAAGFNDVGSKRVWVPS